ncbi:MAG TPA: PaaI family thioesterase [Allosphingosinicella sp.]|nr:PaaI family thioesterase [Allosphingosinicella sp.]
MPDRHFGLAKAEDLADLDGLEFLRAMMAGDQPSPLMSRTLGFRLVEVEEGVAVFEGEPSPNLLNPLGAVHGGWALTLIDSATGCAVHTTLPPGVGYTTVETKVNFTRAIAPDGGTVRCEGSVVTRGRRIATAEARLLDPEGRVLAHGTSTLMILEPRQAQS